MDLPFNKVVSSEIETAQVAKKFIRNISAGDIVVLNGNLGTGKTFFIKEALKELGVGNVNSPTFAIVNEYYGNCRIYHFDFYRINEPGELFDIGFNDYLNDNDAIIFVEWGELFLEMLPQRRYEIKITMNENFSRNFQIIRHE